VRKNKIVLVLNSLLIYSAFCSGLFAAGEKAGDFLFLEQSARASAMGGAFAGLSDDSACLYFNPAGLGNISFSEVSFMHNAHFEGINQEYLAGVWKINETSGLGMSYNLIDWGNIKRTTILNPYGTGDKFQIKDSVFSIAYGRRFDRLSFGLTFKAIKDEIDAASAGAIAADVGALFKLSQLRIGMSVQNFGTKLKYKTKEEKLPLNFKLGGNYKFLDEKISLVLDLNKGEDFIVNSGVEFWILSQMALRAGYTTRNEAGSGISAGFGFKLNKFGLDYAVVPYGDLGYGHRVSLVSRFGEVKKPPK